jgi:hypothetical protein
LEESLTEGALRYSPSGDIEAGAEWNALEGPQFAKYAPRFHNAALSFSFETPYFGKRENVFTPESGLALGKSFYRALLKYLG